MLVKALTNFAGKISMCVGEIKDIQDENILKDLMQAGYIEPEIQEAEIVEKPAKKPVVKKKK